MSSSNIYSSPLCSCVICKQVKSAKGIHAHYHTAHTIEGNARARINASKQNYTASKKRAVACQEKYSRAPNLCALCQTPLTYKQRFNKFCSHSCAAITNNASRDYQIYTQQSATIKQTLSSKPQYSSVRYLTCQFCNHSFWFSAARNECSTKFCSVECRRSQKSKLASEHFRRINAGGVRPSKRINYRGVMLGSTYEVQLAKLLDSLSIKWIKPKSFTYTIPSGKTSTYTADLYLPEFNIYLDPKNDFLIHNINPGNKLKDIDKIAFAVEQNSITVAIIDRKNITIEFILKLVGQVGFEPTVILSCKDSGFDHSHHCPIKYLD